VLLTQLPDQGERNSTAGLLLICK